MLIDRELEANWRRLVGIYPTWTLPLDFVVSPSTWRLFGADLLRGPLKDKKTQRAWTILEAAPAARRDALAKLASINLQRTTNVFTSVAISYVSLPLALAALVSDVAPMAIRTALSEHFSTAIVLVATLALAPAIYFCSMWRARQLTWAILLHHAHVLASASRAH